MVRRMYLKSKTSFQVTFTNVIGILKGERFGKVKDKLLGVTAHYDTRIDTPGIPQSVQIFIQGRIQDF